MIVWIEVTMFLIASSTYHFGVASRFPQSSIVKPCYGICNTIITILAVGCHVFGFQTGPCRQKGDNLAVFCFAVSCAYRTCSCMRVVSVSTHGIMFPWGVGVRNYRGVVCYTLIVACGANIGCVPL